MIRLPLVGLRHARRIQQPCGTVPALRRHRYRDEVVDDACDEANKKHERERAAARRARGEWHVRRR
jgi:hypothetical protein